LYRLQRLFLRPCSVTFFTVSTGFERKRRIFDSLRPKYAKIRQLFGVLHMARMVLHQGKHSSCRRTNMNGKQAGFTLVEIAIVLVIIGLLLGGVLKGQELINSAKVKNFAQDFRTIPLFIYGYQDKYRALPGDDSNVTDHVSGAIKASASGQVQGNGVIEGNWDSTDHQSESVLFWQHVRMANLASGPTDFSDDTKAAASLPTNADGGRIGIESTSAHYIKNSDGTWLSGTYLVCSGGIQGKFAKQLDITMDDGKTDQGSMRVVATGHTRGDTALPNSSVDDGTNYTVCLAF
jgi:prepilin-type N-terminal cleavage/methylation domain-containing protein